MAGADWSRWVPVFEKMLSDLKALNAYLRGEIERGEYCKRVGIAEQDRHDLGPRTINSGHNQSQ